MLYLVIVSSLVLLALVSAFVWVVVSERIKEKRYLKRLAQVNADYWAEWEQELLENTPEEFHDMLGWSHNLNG